MLKQTRDVEQEEEHPGAISGAREHSGLCSCPACSPRDLKEGGSLLFSSLTSRGAQWERGSLGIGPVVGIPLHGCCLRCGRRA